MLLYLHMGQNPCHTEGLQESVKTIDDIDFPWSFWVEFVAEWPGENVFGCELRTHPTQNSTFTQTAGQPLRFWGWHI